MSVKKHKRRNVKHSSSSKKTPRSSLLIRYPRLLLTMGIVLVITSILLLTIGYVSDARVGLSMISLFFGVSFIIFSNSAPNKHGKSKHS